MKYLYIRDLVQRKTVKLQYIATTEKVVDILTKPLTSRQLLDHVVIDANGLID